MLERYGTAHAQRAVRAAVEQRNAAYKKVAESEKLRKESEANANLAGYLTHKDNLALQLQATRRKEAEELSKRSSGDWSRQWLHHGHWRKGTAR